MLTCRTINGKTIACHIPVLSTQLIPDWSYVEEFNKLSKENRKNNMIDSMEFAVGLLSLTIQMCELRLDEPTRDTIVRTAQTPRSYIVETPSREIRRNRQHLNVELKPSNTESDNKHTRNKMT